MKLIVGLGNPGRAYAASRHNVGFMCLSHFARAHGIALIQKQARSRIGRGEVAGAAVILARPRTYMNLSGEAVSLLVRRFGVPPADLLVIHDDLDLPLGKLRIRQRGGSGGHKGVQSIITSLGSEDFPRIRVGIGHPEDGDDTVSYVLASFTPAERQVIKEVIPQVSAAVHCLLTEGTAAAMNRYN